MAAEQAAYLSRDATVAPSYCTPNLRRDDLELGGPEVWLQQFGSKLQHRRC